MHDGVPLCALDMHSEIGRASQAEFFEASTELQRFARDYVPGGSHRRLFRMAIFHAESGLLDRRLASEGLDELTEFWHCEEVRRLGMSDPSRRFELYDILRSEAFRLAAIRLKHLHSAGSAR
jgi:hypothetical protein